MVLTSWSRPFGQIALLFIFGFAAGTLLQRGGLLPVLHGSTGSRPAVIAPAPTPLRGVDDVTSLAPSAPQSIDQPTTRYQSIVGDGNEARDSLRRAVVVTARKALVLLCDVDARIAFQITLRDYARAYAEAPSFYRTTLDSEVRRALTLSHHAGLIDPVLVERWRGAERSALASLLAQQGLSLPTGLPDGPCRNG